MWISMGWWLLRLMVSDPIETPQAISRVTETRLRGLLEGLIKLNIHRINRYPVDKNKQTTHSAL